MSTSPGPQPSTPTSVKPQSPRLRASVPSARVKIQTVVTSSASSSPKSRTSPSGSAKRKTSAADAKSKAKELSPEQLERLAGIAYQTKLQSNETLRSEVLGKGLTQIEMERIERQVTRELTGENVPEPEDAIVEEGLLSLIDKEIAAAEAQARLQEEEQAQQQQQLQSQLLEEEETLGGEQCMEHITDFMLER